MKKFNWKSLIPHAIAVGVFLIIALVYCKPALEGKVLQQIDITGWKGSAQSAFEYKEKNGHFPLWNTHVFSGMPNYQIAMEGKSFLPNITAILTLGLPKPANFFFLACICFYFLCMVLRSNTVVGILGSLAFAFCSYNAIIIEVGHDSKMWAIAYLPALLAGLLLIYNKKYILGFLLTAIFATMEIGVNHPQINFYFAIIAVFLTASCMVYWVKTKDWKHIFIAAFLSLIAVGVGLANSSITLLTTSEYTKYTIRGGKLIESGKDGEVSKSKSTGLDADYGFSYSAGKSEFLTFLMPDAAGRSLGNTSDIQLDENAKLVQVLVSKGVPEGDALNIAQQAAPIYWGGIFPSTSGPVYLGAIICILFVIGMVVVDDKYRWWIFGASLFAIIISWGKYFAGFNMFLFEHLPLYNKFRAPSMAMVIPQFLFPIMAVLTLQKIFFTEDGKALVKTNFKKILIATGAVFVVVLAIYAAADFSSPYDEQLKSFGDGKLNGAGGALVGALRDDRKGIFMQGFLQALVFALVTLGAVWAYFKTNIKPVYLVAGLLVINSINMLVVDSKYLNENNYIDDESYNSQTFAPNAAEVEIMKDKDPHYRVFNVSRDFESEGLTSYHLRSIGGYHPAKLSIYQDLLTFQVEKNNQHVLDMLDVRYLIAPPQQQGQQSAAIRRDSTLGACWFVKEVKFVDGPAEAMKAMDNFNPAQTAFVENSFKAQIPQLPVADSAASIKLAKYDNDDITYTTTSATNQFAVFSEVYYPAGWQAYIDGKATDYVKTNYALRGIYVPQGNHTIEFKFSPSSYNTGQTLTYIGNAAIWVAFICFIAAAVLKRRKNNGAAIA